jgi:hypothetical protein
MKRCTRLWSLGLLALLVLANTPALAAEYPDDVIATKQAISGPMLVSHISFLASDHCRGRETGEDGMDVAAKYLTTVLQGSQIQPAGDFGGYYQDVPLRNVFLGQNNRLEFTTSRGNATQIFNAKLSWDFLPVYLSSQQEVTAPVVFAGYGITAEEHGYDDYAGLDARGKIVMVLRHEPGENDASSPFEGRENSTHGTLLSKIVNAQKHGAIGLIAVTDPLNHDSLEPSATGGTSWPSLLEERYKDDEDFKFYEFSPKMRIVGDEFGVRIPVVSLHGDAADRLLGHETSLLKIQESIDDNLRPQSFAVRNTTAHLAVDFDLESVDAYNIVAKVTGSDPELADEYVIVGAHYDHVGKDKRGRVFPGADDNASGTAGVIELARAFQALEHKPKRTVVFVLFTAEEKGLLGSRYFVDKSDYAEAEVLAMVNLDMIGRNAVDQISLIGRYQYPKLYAIIDEANRSSANFEINFSVERYVRQSDHIPFMRKKIPSVFFNSGGHDQLHRPEDTTGRIVQDKIEKVTQMIFLSLWDIANLPAGTSLSEGSAS